jgi:hypothetical protein
MSRKGGIAVVLASVGLTLAIASSAAFAGSPLLSGYGGPGAGEQAVIGSTLIGGSGGGAGSGGSSGSAGSSSSGASSTGAAPAGGGSSSGATSPLTGGGSAAGKAGGGSGGNGVHGAAGSRHGSSHAAGSPSTHAGVGNTGVQIHAFVYPTGLRSASYDSPALGISGTDVLLFLAAIATLALVAAMTLRLSRLQREL